MASLAPLTERGAELSEYLLDDAVLGVAAARAGFVWQGMPEIARVHFSRKRPAVIQLRILAKPGATEAPALLAEVLGNAAREHAAAETERLVKSRRAQLVRGRPSPVLADDLTGLVFRPPGYDARLPGLRLLHDPEAACAFVTRFTGTPGPTEVRLMAHRLGKRAVLRIRTATGTTVFVRLGPTGNDGPARAFEHHCRIATLLADRPEISVPRPLGFCREFGAAVYAALPGRPPRLSGICGQADTRAALAALKVLHALPSAGLRPHGASAELALIEDWSRRVEKLRPAWTGMLNAALDRVAASLRTLAPTEAAFCHRDFHEGQILVDEGRTGVMDFDTASCADPMLDVGNLAAHYRLHELRTGTCTHTHELIATLGPDGQCDLAARRSVAIWRRAALLRLACIYALTSEPDDVVRGLFTEAAA